MQSPTGAGNIQSLRQQPQNMISAYVPVSPRTPQNYQRIGQAPTLHHLQEMGANEQHFQQQKSTKNQRFSPLNAGG